METIEMLRKRIVDARVVGDSDFEQTAMVMFVAFGHRLEDALRKYADKIVEAACCNNAQRLRELHDGLCALHTCLVAWKLVAEELGIFLKKGGNNNAQA